MIPAMSIRRSAFAACALALLAGAAPALAQVPLPPEGADPLDIRDARRVERMEKIVRELRSIVYQGRDTGKPVVVQPAETDYQLQSLLSRVNDLESALTRINGQLETTAYELEQMRRRNEALQGEVQSLSARLLGVEGVVSPPTPAADLGPAGDAGLAGGDPAAAFAEARRLMDAGDYAMAEQAFADFVARHPDAAEAPEARYWHGRALAVRGAHQEAALAFIAAVRDRPRTGWAPDAMLQLSRSLIALNRNGEACQTLTELGRAYPNAPAAVKSRATAARSQARCG